MWKVGGGREFGFVCGLICGVFWVRLYWCYSVRTNNLGWYFSLTYMKTEIV